MQKVSQTTHTTISQFIDYLIVLLSNARTNFVGRFSEGLIEPTKIVLHPNNFPASISVSGLSPTITAQEGSTPTDSR